MRPAGGGGILRFGAEAVPFLCRDGTSSPASCRMVFCSHAKYVIFIFIFFELWSPDTKR